MNKAYNEKSSSNGLDKLTYCLTLRNKFIAFKRVTHRISEESSHDIR